MLTRGDVLQLMLEQKLGYYVPKNRRTQHKGIWFSGIMLASGARGPGFDSRNPPTAVGSTA